MDYPNLPVTGPLTDTQLRAAAVPVTANAGTNLNTSALALDTSVNGILVSQASTTLGEKGPLVQGAVSTNAPTYVTAQTNPLSLDTAGLLRVSLKDTPVNTVAFKVDGSGVTQPVSGTFFQATQPVSAASLPLPTGAATAALQTTINTTLGSPFQAGGSIGNTSFIANAGTNLNTSALALDTSVNGILVAQGSTTSTQKGPLVQGAVTTGAPSYTTAQTSPLSLNVSGGLRVDGSGVTQPISAASLPLPTLAATSTKQSDGSQKSQIVDGSGNVIASTSNALNTSSAQSGTWNITNISGTVSLPTNASTSGKQDTGNTSLASIDGKITAVNTGAVVVSSSALPSGASTSSLQSTGNTSLASIDTKTPSLGQAAMSASSPVVIASDQSAIPVSGTFYLSTQPISAVSLPLPSNASQETGGNLDQNTLDNLVMKELLQQIVLETRAMRFALVALVTEGMRNNPIDFDPNNQNFANL